MGDKTKHYKRVEEFMRDCLQQVGKEPHIPPTHVRLLRARLILEEALETVKALGFHVSLDLGADEVQGPLASIAFENLRLSEDEDFPPNLEEIADGCADIAVVTTGTLIACGITDKSLQREVDENNLLKLANGQLDEYGKLIKHKDHPKPAIGMILKAQRNEKKRKA